MQRHETAPEDIDGRRWYVDGNKLVLTYPLEDGLHTTASTIVSFTPSKFVLQDDGIRQEFERFP